jgi:hypothetical protein
VTYNNNINNNNNNNNNNNKNKYPKKHEMNGVGVKGYNSYVDDAEFNVLMMSAAVAAVLH